MLVVQVAAVRGCCRLGLVVVAPTAESNSSIPECDTRRIGWHDNLRSGQHGPRNQLAAHLFLSELEESLDCRDEYSQYRPHHECIEAPDDYSGLLVFART
jgi:hypothetical protein